MADKLKKYLDNNIQKKRESFLASASCPNSKTRLQATIDRDKFYYMDTFGDRTKICFTHGEGVFLYGCDGKKYMDLLGGIAVNVLGHANKNLVHAISSQAASIIHCSNLYYIENQSLLAEKLVNLSPGMDKVFFTSSGAEANEGAIKLARAYFNKKNNPRPKIITALNSFHGRTLATVTATGQEKYKKYFSPLPSGFIHIPFNDIDAATKAIDENTSAVMLELIQGESGIIPADMDFVSEVANSCTKSGALLIIDEIQTGMGRTGSFFAYEQYGITPDIVTVAKGLGGGVPIGAFMASDKVAKAFSPGDHGTTFGGNPLSCAAALAVLEEYELKNLVLAAKNLGDFFDKKLKDIAKETGKISDVRCRGLMIGFTLKSNDSINLKNTLSQMGYLVNSIGENIIRILPPLIITELQITAFCEDLKRALSE